MSMNIIYDLYDLDGNYVTSKTFNVQIPTEISHKIVATENKTEQLGIIREYLTARCPNEVDYLMQHITRTLSLPYIKLGLI